MLMTNPVALDESAVSELKKMMEKKRITNVIAPEHNKRHHDHENKMKNEEEMLIEQTISHCNTFRSGFKKSAKGDWVDSAMSELDKIGESLKSIVD
ncbi:hypothetical protein [Staphylococcus edaphicus]|uniref:Uncharacterized protein n=1 Tax=Staphylococcus edaphicus TaxID=1955013 RepID=A0A2C6WNZ1_9STAP|nr:hypothetical protein [Staphylococcus edaphicus]PHK50099.1 hypothetical protein BTJ66_04935 [Staphylococcus edaphicus]UQW81594.1 hypothetical protein MNY58_00265 [Staphylococcus edaphicus]